MRENNRLLATLAVVTFTLVALFHLASAKAGYSHYRDIHLGTAIEYAKGGIDILRPVIVGFNATGTPTPQEFPIWQALAAAMFRCFGPWFGWANLLSLILFATGLWPLHALATTYLGRRGAWWTVIFLLAQPIVILISGQASADGLSFSLGLWFLFFADKLIRSGQAVWAGPAAIFGTLSAVTKLPLYMSVGLTSCFMLLVHAPRSTKRWVLLIAIGAISGALFMAWSRYADSCFAIAEFPYVDLSLSRNLDMWRWFFGDWHYRLNPFNWGKAGWAALNSVFGSFALMALPGWALLFSRNRLGKLWLLAAFCTTFVFCHLILVHRHYFILYSPSIALLSASAILRIEELMKLQKHWQELLAVAGFWAVLSLSSIQGLMGIKVVLNYDRYPHEVARTIDENTNPQDKLLIEGGGWGGEVLFLSQRKGMSINDTHLLENPKVFSRLSALGYTKLVMISESPLLHALQVIDPGNLERKRITYRAALTPVAEPWKTIFQSDDVLIKELPEAAH
jgi:hypothetical protein